MQRRPVVVVRLSQSNMQKTSFSSEKKITAQEYIGLLSQTSLGERRFIEEVRLKRYFKIVI